MDKSERNQRQRVNALADGERICSFDAAVGVDLIANRCAIADDDDRHLLVAQVREWTASLSRELQRLRNHRLGLEPLTVTVSRA